MSIINKKSELYKNILFIYYCYKKNDNVNIKICQNYYKFVNQFLKKKYMHYYIYIICRILQINL